MQGPCGRHVHKLNAKGIFERSAGNRHPYRVQLQSALHVKTTVNSSKLGNLGDSESLLFIRLYTTPPSACLTTVSY